MQRRIEFWESLDRREVDAKWVKYAEIYVSVVFTDEGSICIHAEPPEYCKRSNEEYHLRAWHNSTYGVVGTLCKSAKRLAATGPDPNSRRKPLFDPPRH